MKEWHIKEISDLTNTSIRMLRHYDKIDLLKPSYRSANGYRCYTEKDLSLLQQIIALKYLGFSLSSIKDIMQKHDNVYAHLQAQKSVIQEQSNHLQEVNKALNDILLRLSPSETPTSNDSILLISRYHMTQNIKKFLKEGWAGKALSEEQFNQYLSIYEKFPEEFIERDKIIAQINNNELGAPDGPDGERVHYFMRDLAKKLKESFSEQVEIGCSLLKDIQSGKLTELEVNNEGALWLSKAALSSCLKRWDALYETILESVTLDPKGERGEKVAKEWARMVDETFTVGNRSFLTGIMLWQELARQDNELKDLKTIPSPQEMVSKVHVKLLFNADATVWINQALDAHAN